MEEIIVLLAIGQMSLLRKVVLQPIACIPTLSAACAQIYANAVGLVRRAYGSSLVLLEIMGKQTSHRIYWVFLYLPLYLHHPETSRLLLAKWGFAFPRN